METVAPQEDLHLKELSARMILETPREDLDDLFRGSPTGDIPEGRTRGTALVWTGSIWGTVAAAIVRLVAWKGKVFSSETADLKNLISPFGIPAIRASVFKDISWFDGREAIILDYSNTSFVAQKIRDEMREVTPGLYLGVVYWGRKRIAGFMLETPAAAQG